MIHEFPRLLFLYAHIAVKHCLFISAPYVYFGGISASAYQPLSTVLQSIIHNQL